MTARLAAITFILLCTSVAWFILATTIGYRTYQSDDKLRLGVASIWGSPEEQTPPMASYERSVQIPLDASRIDVTLTLDHRQKGLLWYSTYVVDFAAIYTFHNPTTDPQTDTLSR